MIRFKKPWVALGICGEKLIAMRQVLQDAYENKSLRGKRLLLAKKLIEERDLRGKAIRKGSAAHRKHGVASAQDVIEAYQQNVNKKRLLVRKSEMVNNNLIFITEALRQMYEDDNFRNLLKAEGLTSFPKPIADMIKKKGSARV